MASLFEEIPTKGTHPNARFGHTICPVSRGKACLFGGATKETFVITNDTFLLDMATATWKKLENVGAIPCQRAAHCMVQIDEKTLALFGGAVGNGGLAQEGLYILNLNNEEKADWIEASVTGVSPPRRYGHAMVFTQPFLVIFGGNTGSETVNDVWCLNTEASQFYWQKVVARSESPLPRVYHSGYKCTIGSAKGMIVIFGGRANSGESQLDTWGLRRHRDGSWDWIKAPQKKDSGTLLAARYQHSCHFVGSLFFVVGGRGNTGVDALSLDVYDTETSEWLNLGPFPRFRHASWVIENNLFVYGGFGHDQPSVATASLLRINIDKVLEAYPSFQRKARIGYNASPTPTPSTSPIGTPHLSPQTTSSSSRMQIESQKQVMAHASQSMKGPNMYSSGLPNKGPGSMAQTQPISETPMLGKKNIKFGNQVFLASEEKKTRERKIFVNSSSTSVSKGRDQELALEFIRKLLQPKTFINYPENANSFCMPSEKVLELCRVAQGVLESQSMLLSLRSPAKIFGDIHGQYSDLMRFFDLWGVPCEGDQDKDIETFDYVFLGDYVDRGSHSLETICLLLALKVRYPDQIHLLRGNHEDEWINMTFGFADECANRLNEDYDHPNSVFKTINALFQYLPLAAIIDDKVVCLHGGIGESLKHISQIEAMERPLEVIHEVSTAEQQLIVDVLWSDPTDSDQEMGIHANTIRDPQGTGNIVKFGPDRVRQFLNDNNLSMIIRAHECVMDGFERFAGGSLITVFSATDYCGKHKNAGAVLILGKNAEITPKLIYPSTVMGSNNWMDDEEALKHRPPTPPRWRSGMAQQKLM